jgi:predicted 2-oxoglutarate/Fe(II)-dependent dioxygenase YbiX
MKFEEIIPGQIFVIHDFLTTEECREFILLSEGEGYDNAPINSMGVAVMRPGVRNNDRVIIDDEALAGRLWERLKPFAPSPLHRREAVGLNERFRFYRYAPGQRFKLHYDGAFERVNGERSQLTFMVYLNAECEGGETRFDLRYPQDEVLVKPQRGMALCFVHDLLHEGAPVRGGLKYVLRSDVMYSWEKQVDLELQK